LLVSLALGAVWLSTASAQPRRVVPGQEPDRPIDSETRKQVVETTAQKLWDFYVVPELAEKMATRIRERERAGAYDAIQSSAALAKALTDDIRSVNKDLHTYVLYSYGVINDPPPPKQDVMSKPPPGVIRSNFGFRRLEILDGNVGYMDLRGFVKPDFAANTAAAAMNFIANSDALIIDLRSNQGGDPGMVQLLCTYFFGLDRVHLGDSYKREGNKTEEIWTLASVQGPRYTGKAVFILTSRQTFSGAEAFAYSLQALKRAVIVGERTAGGAYGGGRQSINQHFDLLLSTSRSFSAVTKTDWEGSGVQPDIPIPVDQALETALTKARTDISVR